MAAVRPSRAAEAFRRDHCKRVVLGHRNVDISGPGEHGIGRAGDVRGDELQDTWTAN